MLIPKHQNKTSKEIAEMYLTHPRKPQKSLTQLTKSNEKKGISPGLGKFSVVKSGEPSNLPAFNNSKAEINYQDTKVKSAYELSQEIIQYSTKTAEIQNDFAEDERRILKKIQESVNFIEKKKVKVNHLEIVENFKDEALNIDQKISALTEENKMLKEKLALATLEEVDERIRREKPSDRFIEKYSNKLLETDPEPRISDLLSKLNNSHSPEENSDLISSFCSNISEKSLQVYITHLCQLLSNNKKVQKKQEIDNKRLLRLKQEVVYRLQQTIKAKSPQNPNFFINY